MFLASRGNRPSEMKDQLSLCFSCELFVQVASSNPIVQAAMDKVLNEVIGHVFALLPTADLLNCRLVSRLFKNQVDRHFEFVKCVRINETLDFEQTFVPDVLFPPLVTRYFECKEKNFDCLFTFLEASCRNLQVVSAHNNRLALNQLVKVSKCLVYFEADNLDGLEGKKPEELWPLFPSLQAVYLQKRRPMAFCPNEWLARPGKANKAEVAKFIQWRDVCCDDPSHEQDVANFLIPPGSSWFTAHKNYLGSRSGLDLVEPFRDQLSSAASSLRILELSFDDISLRFELPNLKKAKFYFAYNNPSEIIDSLKNSSDLQVLDLHFSEFVKTDADVTDALFSLVSTLKQLKSLALTRDRNHEPLHLSLPPKLIFLKLEGFRLEPTSQSSSVKFLDLVDSDSSFNFANLVCCRINIDQLNPLEISESINCLQHSTCLRKLNFEVTTRRVDLTHPIKIIDSVLGRLTKLESIAFQTLENVPPLTLNLPHCPFLKYFEWHASNPKNIERVKINLDKRYESAVYESETKFTMKSEDGQQIKFNVSSKDIFHFKFPLEDTLTQVTFITPATKPSFRLPQLVECKVILLKNEKNTIETLCHSLMHSPKLQSLTLIAKLEVTINLGQVVFLLWCLNKMNQLRELKGVVYFKDPSPHSFDFESEYSKFSSLNRVKSQLRFIHV